MVFMSKNKRKGHDESTDVSMNMSRSVVFSPRTGAATTTSSNWMDCKGRLDSIWKLCNSENDPVLDDVATISTNRNKSFSQQLQNKLSAGDAVHQALERQISATNLRLQDESAAAVALRGQFQTLVRHADFIQQQVAAAEQQGLKLAQETAKYRDIADAEGEIMELTRQQRAKQVPRLQQQLSLYATMTGIKWDFEAQEQMMENHCLVGEVVRGHGQVQQREASNEL